MKRKNNKFEFVVVNEVPSVMNQSPVYEVSEVIEIIPRSKRTKKHNR